MAKTVSIIQSNYIPWKGYFDLIGLADEFIVLDSVQFTKNDWRNRNRIRTLVGTSWLTIPVKTGGRFGQTIEETEVADSRWAERHWSNLRANYGTLAGFKLYEDAFARAYADASREVLLSRINRLFTDLICEMLDIRTVISSASAYDVFEGRNERVVGLCKSAAAAAYLTGPAGIDYLNKELFAAAGVEIKVMDYSGYPEYAQIASPFEPQVSILDLLFSTGAAARNFMKFPAYRAAHPWSIT